MKLKLLLTSAAALVTAGFLSIMLFSTTGCGTLGGGGGNVSTNSVWNDPTFVTNTAFALKATVANGVVIANAEDKNAAAYIVAVRDALAKFVGGKDYTPGALETALSNVSVKELKGQYAQLIIVNLDLVYETYWGQGVRDSVNRNLIVSQLIQAVIDGIDLGLKNQVPTPPVQLQNKWKLQRSTMNHLPYYYVQNGPVVGKVQNAN